MNETLFSELSAWMTQAGLAGTPETDIVSVFCGRCVAAGIPLGRAHVFIDTLQLVYEGQLFRWGYSPSESSVHEYGRTRSEGFDLPAPVSLDVQATEIWRRKVPSLALAIKSVSLARMTRTLMETYLGRDAGQRVLSGQIVRGTAERIDAVVWFSDLRGFTGITDTTPEQVIPLLNDYSDVIVSAIHEHGGDVLKLIGDGTLAIFTGENRIHACNAALSAAIAARRGVAELKEARMAEDKPVTDMYLGLHVGKVFYGNVGSRERLDFTVLGAAVNEASRIAAMCRSVDQPILMSAAFANIGDMKRRLVSVGRYALRGVSHPQELFTLDPGAQAVC